MNIVHKQQWEFLTNGFSSGKLPQALLFSGEDGLGQKKLAFDFIKLLFCQQENKPCLVCPSCLMVDKFSHPDFIFLTSQNKDIQIDQIRDLQSALSLKPCLASQKAVIIEGAHNLNIQAQNCFLKTLEEPKTKTTFVLISSWPDVLLSTIRSRCATIKFYPQRKEQEKIIPMSNEAKQLLQKDLAGRLIFIKHFFEKNKENVSNELHAFLEGMVWVLRSALWQKLSSQDEKTNPTTFLRLKKAIELTEEAKYLLQTTNVSARLLLENLAIQI